MVMDSSFAINGYGGCGGLQHLTPMVCYTTSSDFTGKNGQPGGGGGGGAISASNEARNRQSSPGGEGGIGVVFIEYRRQTPPNN
jgi:hypothetical protein